MAYSFEEYIKGSTIGTGNLVFREYYLRSVPSFTNLSNWNYTLSQNNYSNEYSNGVNHLTLTTKSNYDTMYVQVPVIPNKTYRFQFEMCSPTGFTYGGYGVPPFYHEYAAVCDSFDTDSPIQEMEDRTKLAATQYFNNEASNTPVTYTAEFYSDSNTSVFVCISFGYITDNTTTDFIFSNIRLVLVE